MLAAIGYGVFVGIINMCILGLLRIWIPFEFEFMIALSLGVAAGNGLMYFFKLVGH